MTQNLKVLHIVPVHGNGGLPTFLRHQIDSLGEQTETLVLSFRGVDLKFKTPIKSLKNILTFIHNVRSSRADVIHAHWGSLLGFLTVMAVPKEIPVVLTLRGSDVNKAKSEKWFENTLRRRLSRCAIRQANFCIFVSAQLYDSCDTKLTNFAIIPDGTPLQIFKPRSKVETRKLLFWSQESKYILFYCGGRPVDKNLSLAKDSIEILKKKIDNLEFIIIESAFSQIELASMMASADAFLFTSLNEGSPNIVREAIACGCPVVSVSVGDVERWVNLSGVGQICDYDAQSLSLALEKVVGENQMANSNIALEYSVEKTSERILDIYLKLVSNNGH